MTADGRSVTWKWVAAISLAIVGVFLMGLIDDVSENSTAISGMKSDIKHMAKQVAEIHGVIFQKAK